MARATSEKTIGRRSALRGLVALPLASFASFGSVGACSGTRTASRPEPRPFGGPVELYSWFDLAKDPRSQELSGIAWDERTRTLWAVQDHTARLVELRPDDALRKWTFGPGLPVNVSGALDLEGIVVLHPPEEGFIVSSEDGPRILELGRDGDLRREIVVPPRFRDARSNKSLESLSMTRDSRYLFTTSEIAVEGDGAGPSKSNGTRVRIARFDRTTGEVASHAYLTDPAIADGADYGIADVAALAADELLVLERGWAKGIGNTVRIYRAVMEERAACFDGTPLTAESVFVPKSLLVDLSTLDAHGLPPAAAPQATPLLDNYEGLAHGPVLPDGRRSLFVVSDDNARRDQVARLLVLAVGAGGA